MGEGNILYGVGAALRCRPQREPIPRFLGINRMVYPEGTHPEGLPYEKLQRNLKAAATKKI